MNLGENIYRLRTERSLSQGNLADALDVSRQSVSKWENNSATPELEKLLKMSELFSMTLDQLVGKEPPIHISSGSRPPQIPVRASMPVHRILGIILLCFGLASFLILTIMNGTFAGFLCSAPLITVGIICTVCTDNLMLRCLWGIFSVFVPVACLFILNMVRRKGFFCLAALLVWFAILLIWTIAGIRKGKISKGAKKMAFGCTLFAVLVIGITISSVAYRSVNHNTTYSVEASAIMIE